MLFFSFYQTGSPLASRFRKNKIQFTMFETQWLKIELKNHEYNTTIIVLKLSTHFREKSLIISKFVVALSLIRIFLRHYPYFLTFLTRCSSTGFYLNEKVGLKWVNKFCMERVRIWIFSDLYFSTFGLKYWMKSAQISYSIL